MSVIDISIFINELLRLFFCVRIEALTIDFIDGQMRRW